MNNNNYNYNCTVIIFCLLRDFKRKIGLPLLIAGNISFPIIMRCIEACHSKECFEFQKNNQLQIKKQRSWDKGLRFHSLMFQLDSKFAFGCFLVKGIYTVRQIGYVRLKKCVVVFNADFNLLIFDFEVIKIYFILN